MQKKWLSSGECIFPHRKMSLPGYEGKYCKMWEIGLTTGLQFQLSMIATSTVAKGCLPALCVCAFCYSCYGDVDGGFDFSSPICLSSYAKLETGLNSPQSPGQMYSLQFFVIWDVCFLGGVVGVWCIYVCVHLFVYVCTYSWDGSCVFVGMHTYVHEFMEVR